MSHTLNTLTTRNLRFIDLSQTGNSLTYTTAQDYVSVPACCKSDSPRCQRLSKSHLRKRRSIPSLRLRTSTHSTVRSVHFISFMILGEIILFSLSQFLSLNPNIKSLQSLRSNLLNNQFQHSYNPDLKSNKTSYPNNKLNYNSKHNKIYYYKMNRENNSKLNSGSNKCFSTKH